MGHAALLFVSFLSQQGECDVQVNSLQRQAVPADVPDPEWDKDDKEYAESERLTNIRKKYKTSEEDG